jgi:hypothetical protein
MDVNVKQDAVKSENDEKKAHPWYSNPPMAYENYSYSAPFPSPLPSPLDQTQNSLFTSFDGDGSYSAVPPLWYSQMLDGQDMKSFYLMRQGFTSASEALVSSPSMPSMIQSMAGSGNLMSAPANGCLSSGQMTAHNGSMTTLVGSINRPVQDIVRRGSISSLSTMHPGTAGTAGTAGDLSSMTASSNGLQSPPVTPYLNENLPNLGNVYTC